MLRLRPADFVKLMRENNLRRGYIINENILNDNTTITNKMVASSPLLQPIADWITNESADFRHHEALFFQISNNNLMTATIWKTIRGQGAGGARYWPYDTMEALFTDGLRLSLGMGRKNALAGLWHGGAKGVINNHPLPLQQQGGDRQQQQQERKRLFEDYGRFMTSLRGCYVTAEDAGINVDDVANIFLKTRFTTCIPVELGGSGNPSPSTAIGVVCGMEGALAALAMGTLEGKTVAIQGVGNCGFPMVKELLKRKVKNIVAVDINLANVVAANNAYASSGKFSCKKVEVGDTTIFKTEADIFAPNALGAILNPNTIPLFHPQLKIIAGSANNQLEVEKRDAQLLQQRKITYVPDFLCNRMGIVNCANEAYGYYPNDEMIVRHFGREWDNSIFKLTQQVITAAAKEGTTTSEIANKLADKLACDPHPIMGHRSRKIIQGLVQDEWDKQAN